MAKIKYTKNELKAQRDALARYERYLPTLQLKRQQMQIEVRHAEAALDAKRAEEAAAHQRLARWVKLFSEPMDFDRYLRVARVETSTGNIAGVSFPVFERIEFDRLVPDLFATPAWLDDALSALQELVRLRIEILILEEQLRQLREELRVTTQRVNLFEKVKIPQTRENIRVIRIFLGDQMTAEVVRSKFAKAKTVEKVRATAAP
ncbi:MAG: V-type ATP synthase subunit D [Verrucomicrobiae bacterium]|nr:V-type ATP synthase subunit D [Verrucomicrobiae bacterium]